MDKGKTVILILFLLALGMNVFLVMRLTIMTDERATMLKVNDQILSYFQNSNIPCQATNEQPKRILACITDLNDQYATGMMELDGYQNVNPRTDEPGYLILKNAGEKALASADFVLTKNHNVEDSGCAINGTITKDEPCRLTFNTPCEPGDSLEVTYQGKRVYIKTC